MKRFLMTIAVVITAMVSFSQEKESDSEETRGFQREKVFVGGNFGLAFGTYTLVNVSPQVGYRFNRYLAAGTGVNFQYSSFRRRDWNNDLIYKSSRGVAGLNVFGRVYPIRSFMLQVQPEANYVFGRETYYQPVVEKYNMNAEIVPSLLTGAGVVLPSGRGAMIISLFYDLLQKDNAPYGKRPFVNFNFNVGL